MTTRNAVEAGALPAGWVMRAATTEDIDRAVELMNARSQKLYGENQVTREDVEAWWKSPRFDRETDLRLVLDAGGEIAGIANVNNPGVPYAQINCAGVAHPRHEARAELWDWMHAWAVERARELVPLADEKIRVAAGSSTARQDEARRASLERAGFESVRVANHMEIVLAESVPEARWPEGVAVRTVRVEQDLRALVALFLESWRDHYGFVARPFDDVLADWRDGITSEGERFDPTLWFVAVDGNEIVGISLCNSHIADDLTRGYVQGLGVRPAWRKRGIALALLRHSFAEFRRRGYAAVELDMDSENLTGALRVYERAGMQVIRQSVFYEKELRPGVDLVTRELAG